MPRYSGKNLIGIARVNSQLRNLLAVAQAEVRPSLAGVSGFVDAVADGEVGAMQPLAATDINNVGVGRRYSQRPDGTCGLIVEDRLPGAPEVVCLPHPAVAHADIEDVGLAGNSGDGARASSPKWADRAPVQRLEQGRIELR